MQVAHSAIETAHTEDTAPREGKGGGRNVVLNGKAGRRQLFPIEAEFLAISHVEHTVHQLEPFLAVQKLGRNAQAMEVVHKVNLNVVEARLGLLHGVSFNSKCQVLAFGEAVVALLQLLAKHHAVLSPHIVEAVVLIRNADALFKGIRISRHIHERQLKMDAGIKEIQEGTPFLKDCGFILLLRQLIVDVLELNCFGVIPICNTANAVREHTLKRDGLLRGAGNPIVPFGSFQCCLQLLLLSVGEFDRLRFCVLFLSDGQFAVPPVQACPDESGQHNSCLSDRGAPWDG